MIEIDQTNVLRERERETNNIRVFYHLPLTLKKYCTSHALKCYIEKRNIQGSLYAFLRLFWFNRRGKTEITCIYNTFKESVYINVVIFFLQLHLDKLINYIKELYIYIYLSKSC